MTTAAASRGTLRPLSPEIAPPLIVLDLPKCPVTLMDAGEEDDDILEILLDGSSRNRPGPTASPASSSSLTIRPPRVSTSLDISAPVFSPRPRSLRPTAASFVPHARSREATSGPPNEGYGYPIRHEPFRLRQRGALSSAKDHQLDVEVDDDGTITPRLVDTGVSRPSSPACSIQLSLSPSSSPSRSRRASFLDSSPPRYTPTPPSLSSPRGQPSTNALPRYSYSPVAGYTPHTSLSSRPATPLDERQQIPESTEEDISRLFTFDFKPPLADEDVLVQIQPEISKVQLEEVKYDEAEKRDTVEEVLDKEDRRQAQLDAIVPLAGARLISVEPIGDLISLQHRDTSPLLISRPEPVKRILPAVKRKLEAIELPSSREADKAATRTDSLLIDLSAPDDASDCMRRMSGGVARIGVMRTEPVPSLSPEIHIRNQLVDTDVPVASTSRDASDARKIRHRLGIRTPSSAERSRSASPVRTESIRERYAKISPYSQLLSRPAARNTVLAHLAGPGHADALQRTLMSAWQRTEMGTRQKSAIARLLEDVSVALNAKAGLPGSSTVKGKRRFEVDVFGSVSWGGQTGASGDLDLVVLMPGGYDPAYWRDGGKSAAPGSAPELPSVYNMRKVQRILEGIGMRDCLAIKNATTPIVKFKAPGLGMECDINVNDLGGWYNSSLILHYCLISPHVLRPLVHALKLWASAFGLNDASGAKGPPTMSSYCLTMMAIAYLQHLGVLPNLQASARATNASSDRTGSDVIWVGFGKPQGIKAHIAFDRFPPSAWMGKTISAADAIRGFFSFFNPESKSSRPKFDYEHQIISILRGGVADRARPKGEIFREEAKLRAEMQERGETNDVVVKAVKKLRNEIEAQNRDVGKGDEGRQPLMWEEKDIVVQDPFLWQKNCAAGMSKDGIARFFKAINLAETRLQNRDMVFETLIKNKDPIPSRPGTPRRGGRGGGRGGRSNGANTPNSRPKSSTSNGSRSSRGRGRGRGGAAQAGRQSRGSQA